MREVTRNAMVKMAKAGATPVAAIAGAACEAGIVVPSILKFNLEKKGYKVRFTEGPGEEAKEGKGKHGQWVLITRQPTAEEVEGGAGWDIVVARAFSEDKDDSLLQAVYAWMKEEAKETELARA